MATVKMKSITAIRHVHFEDLGVLEQILTSCGISIRYVDAGVDDLNSLYGLGDALLVVLGGPIGAYQERQYPFLADELRILEKRLARELPTLGICLGAQLMARALGARVYQAQKKEIGWGPLILTDAGSRSSIRHLAGERTPVLHWHGDTFDLPPGATLLASTTACPNQAFAWTNTALALQFHAEVRGQSIERWLIGHACELSGTGILDLDRLRDDTVKLGAQLERCATTCFKEWLADVGVLNCV